MIIPVAGTQAHEEFMRKARDPNSFEAGVLRQMMNDASKQVQEQVRQMLHTMIEVVPGQLFRDIERFHEKFELKSTEDPGHRLPEDVLKFRVKFLYEELGEYVAALNATVVLGYLGGVDGVEILDEEGFNAELAFDALIDLVYVALGTAFLHRFPFNEGWDRVQAANMKKVRASGNDDPLSKRKHNKDVVKPPGWVPPVLADLLDEACSQCQGTGTCSTLEVEPDDCAACGGTGRRRRGPTKEATT